MLVSREARTLKTQPLLPQSSIQICIPRNSTRQRACLKKKTINSPAKKRSGSRERFFASPRTLDFHKSGCSHAPSPSLTPPPHTPPANGRVRLPNGPAAPTSHWGPWRGGFWRSGWQPGLALTQQSPRARPPRKLAALRWCNCGGGLFSGKFRALKTLEPCRPSCRLFLSLLSRVPRTGGQPPMRRGTYPVVQK